VTGFHFSANLPQQTQFSALGPVKPQFGSDEKPVDESEKDHKVHSQASENVLSDDSFEKDTKTGKQNVQVEDQFSVPKETDLDDIHAASKVSGMDELAFVDEMPSIKDSKPALNQQVKDKKYWAKSIVLSALSVASLVGMVVAMIPGIGLGMLPALGLILAGLLVHDVSSNISRQQGLMNISDVDYLKGVMAERSEPLLQTASRFFHPFNPEKQALFVQQNLSKVRGVDPHRLLNKTGLDYQSMLNDMKSESSVALKAFIIGRFLALFILKRGLGSYMMGRGKIAAWAALGAWGWISQNKHGTLSDLPPQAFKPLRAGRPSAPIPDRKVPVNA
jgi:hypothetical protein